MRGIKNIGLWLVLVIAMSAGVASTALATSVGVMTWGGNASGQLGDGTTTSRDEPVSLAEPTDVTAVSGGNEFSLALLKVGTVMSWGSSAEGELGRGGGSHTPGLVGGLSEVAAISAGGAHTLALLKNETVKLGVIILQGRLVTAPWKIANLPLSKCMDWPKQMRSLRGSSIVLRC